MDFNSINTVNDLIQLNESEVSEEDRVLFHVNNVTRDNPSIGIGVVKQLLECLENLHLNQALKYENSDEIDEVRCATDWYYDLASIRGAIRMLNGVDLSME